MKKASKIKIFGLEVVLRLLNLITQRIKISRLIKLKLIVGFALLGTKAANAQTVEFPKQTGKQDTLNLNVGMETNTFTMCHEIVMVSCHKTKITTTNHSTIKKHKKEQNDLNKLVTENVQYPDSALKHKIEGSVMIDINIDTTGNITNAIIKKSLGYGLDEEAIRLIKLMPKFEVSKNEEESTNETFEIHFVLPKNNLLKIN